MTSEKLLIIGASGHAKVVIDIVQKEKKHTIVGLIASTNEIGKVVMGHTVIATETDLPQIMQQHPDCSLFIAVGDNWMRHQIYERISTLLPNATFATLIHPSAQIAAEVTIGQGTVVMAGSIINSCSNIGDFVIVNTKSSIDHDNNLGSYSSLAPNATTGGNVSIGDFTAISISATVKHGIQIGKHVVVGAGSIVLKNIEDGMVAYGTPAKNIRSRNPGEKYL